MYKITFVFMCFILTSNIHAIDSKDVNQATCRINNRGTGIVFAEDKTDLWIMTAGHVMVDNDNKLQKEFFVHFYNEKEDDSDLWSVGVGVEPKKFKAEPLWHVCNNKILYKKGKRVGIALTTHDLGFIKVKKDQFGTYPIPKPIRLAPQGTKLEVGQKIMSSGFPGGKEKKDIEGKVTSKKKDRFNYTPGPIPGQSGSGIVTDDGIVGIVIWYLKTNVEKNKYGTAISLEQIYKATKWDQKK
ncbi:MAG: S1 family peptidase [Candidatus Thorarchaeota archaeon]|jgi:hypothetical protein